MGCRIGQSVFDSRQEYENYFLFHSVQTGCGANPGSYKMDTGDCFALSKAAGA
jgi:hypothetical protein